MAIIWRIARKKKCCPPYTQPWKNYLTQFKKKYKDTFFKLRVIFVVGGKTSWFFEQYANKIRGVFLDRVLNFKVDCI